MRRFGLIGYPLSHSFSKKYFTERFLKEGLTDCYYENFPLSSIDQLPSLLADRHLEGFNITIPYKEEIIPFLQKKNKVVESTGACNCVKITSGQLVGYNTDV